MRIEKNASKEVKVMMKSAKPFAEIISWTPDHGVRLVEGYLTDPKIREELDNFYATAYAEPEDE